MIIKYFSWVRDIADKSSEIIDIPNDVRTVDQLINYLSSLDKKYEEIFSKKKLIKIALNKSYVTTNAKIKNSDEIAFFPPVTGG